MYEYQLTVGLFDKDTESQLIPTESGKSIVSDILINRFGVFAFTMLDASGVYRMASTGRIVREPSIRVEIVTDEAMPELSAIVDAIKQALNQESVMVKVTESADVRFM